MNLFKALYIFLHILWGVMAAMMTCLYGLGVWYSVSRNDYSALIVATILYGMFLLIIWDALYSLQCTQEELENDDKS